MGGHGDDGQGVRWENLNFQTRLTMIEQKIRRVIARAPRLPRGTHAIFCAAPRNSQRKSRDGIRVRDRCADVVCAGRGDGGCCGFG